MGCLGSLPEPGFYGGKVSFSMRAHLNKQGFFHFILERPVLGPSSRFTRCYGSSWVIKVRVSMDILLRPDALDKLRSLLLKPLILNGQVYRFFHINKNHHAYLMATNELLNECLMLQPLPSHSQGRYCSFLDFFERHNNLGHNCNQVSYILLNKSCLVLIKLQDNYKMGIKNCLRII
jgi:hypothetical protein